MNLLSEDLENIFRPGEHLQGRLQKLLKAGRQPVAWEGGPVGLQQPLVALGVGLLH